MCYEHEMYLTLLISRSKLLFWNLLLEIRSVVINDYVHDNVTLVFFGNKSMWKSNFLVPGSHLAGIQRFIAIFISNPA
jgi:hypothetical protein